MMQENLRRDEAQAGYGNVEADVKAVASYVSPRMYVRNPKPSNRRSERFTVRVKENGSASQPTHSYV
jgi:hypothetical protein